MGHQEPKGWQRLVAWGWRDRWTYESIGSRTQWTWRCRRLGVWSQRNREVAPGVWDECMTDSGHQPLELWMLDNGDM